MPTTSPVDWLLKALPDPSLRVLANGVVSGVARASAENFLPTLPSSSVDLVLTDPPYFIDKMDGGWSKANIDKSRSRAGVVGSLPVGMKFDKKQGEKLQAELLPTFIECLRILRPGGFLVSFSQARLYHRMAMAADLAGFEIRDMLGWCYEGQAKAFSQTHFIRKMKISDDRKRALIESVGNRKTPQLKPMIEPMVFGQKPKDGTFVDNWMANGVGLIDPSCLWDERFPGNIMHCPKPSAKERGPGNTNPCVKPQKVLQHLIRLLTCPGAVVLDPYSGSGSTQLAALLTGRHCLGAEREPGEVQTIARRLLAAGAIFPARGG